jgi:hypothetical protein
VHCGLYLGETLSLAFSHGPKPQLLAVTVLLESFDFLFNDHLLETSVIEGDLQVLLQKTEFINSVLILLKMLLLK